VVFGIDGRPANADQRVGIGNFCDGLLRALLAISSDASFRIYLDAEPRKGLLGTHHAADLRVLPRRAAWTQRVLATELRREPPDAFLAPGLQFPLRRACPAVATVHDLAYRTFGHCFPWRMRTRCRLEAAYALRSADHLLAVSQSTRQEICRLYGRKDSSVTTIHEGVSPEFTREQVSAQARAIRERYALPDRYVLYVGVLQPRKNLIRLIDAFKYVRGNTPGLPHHLVIAGKEGWLCGPILEAARARAVRDFVHVLGYVPEADLPCLVAQADLLALVSLWEGFGLPTLEAMSCGTAVLASNTSAFPEVVGEAGVLVDPRDTAAIARGLERILTDDVFRRSLESKGLQRSSRFTWERSAETVLEVLRRTAEQPGIRA